jgi:hypothetical protein
MQLGDTCLSGVVAADANYVVGFQVMGAVRTVVASRGAPDCEQGELFLDTTFRRR